MTTNDTFLTLEGNVNDLLMVNEMHSMKCTRLIHFNEDNLNNNALNEEIVDVCITSTNMYGEHPLFDKLLGKKIRITVDILEN